MFSPLFKGLTKVLSGARRLGRRPIWSYSVDGVIWRILPAEAGLLVGEARNLQSKTASFFCLDRRTGRPLWENTVLPEPWWVGIEAIHGGILFLHGFASPEMPARRGITALDLRTGAMLWSSAESEAVGIRPETLLAVRGRFPHREVVELDARTGAVRGAQPADEETFETLRHIQGPSVSPEVLYPLPLGEDESSGRLRRHLLGHWKSLAGVESIERIAHETADVVLIHERVPAGGEMLLKAAVAVLEPRTGALLYRSTVDSGLRRPVPDACCVCDGVLYFLRERTTLVAIDLVSST